MQLSEAEVATAFADWLGAEGWTIKPYPQDRWLDLYAERGSAKLLAEIKGNTSEPGIDADIAYGQLLRRMPDHDSYDMSFALVVPALPRSTRAACRVPRRVREQLRITVYAVDERGRVEQLDV